MITLFSNSILVSALVAQAEPQEASIWPSIWMMGLIILVFYFIVISPQRKEAKARENMRNKLQKGDEVVTVGGMHGQVYSVDKDTVTLRLGGKVEIDFDKSAIRDIKKKAQS